MNWSAEQRRLLDALGYEVLAHGRAMPVAARGAAADVAPSPRPTRPAPPVAPGAPAAGASSQPLMAARRRAATGADPRPLVEDLDVLRRDPLRKRALWPRLRALRRTTP